MHVLLRFRMIWHWSYDCADASKVNPQNMGKLATCKHYEFIMKPHENKAKQNCVQFLFVFDVGGRSVHVFVNHTTHIFD